MRMEMFRKRIPKVLFRTLEKFFCFHHEKEKKGKKEKREGKKREVTPMRKRPAEYYHPI
jgi:hypothetical protein